MISNLLKAPKKRGSEQGLSDFKDPDLHLAE